MLKLLPGFLLLAALLTPPAAAATCVPLVTCVVDDDNAATQCDVNHHNETMVTLGSIGAGWYVWGYENCQGTGIETRACVVPLVTAVCAGVYWRDTPTTCSTLVFIYSPAANPSKDLGCPAGNPPNPGWGHLLPV